VRKLCSCAVEAVAVPVDEVPVAAVAVEAPDAEPVADPVPVPVPLASTLLTRLAKLAFKFAVAGVVAPDDPSCWIRVCKDDSRLPVY